MSENLAPNPQLANALVVHMHGGLDHFTVSTPDGLASLSFHSPTFPFAGEIPGTPLHHEWGNFTPDASPRQLPNGVTEHTQTAPLLSNPNVRLQLIYQVSPERPVIRFRYRLQSNQSLRFFKSNGRDGLIYLQTSCKQMRRLKEVQVSQFNSLYHSFCLAERTIKRGDFAQPGAFFGPILAGESDTHAFLLAYEHGSQVPDGFLQFTVMPSRTVLLEAVKGNYTDGQIIGPDSPFETVWMQVGIVKGREADLAQTYRDWVLHDQSPNAESRQPHLFYNTWNYQERVYNWHKRPYLADMNEARMLAEIEVAHQMGLEVFVIDTGWYEKTGDWQVSRERFPNGLTPIKAKLDSYGMKLGLWFNPTVAARSSEMYRNFADCAMTTSGKVRDPHPVWETEESYGLCLVSKYWEAFADKLIALHRELGVTYFKWDAIGQYGCDSANHDHGNHENTETERRESYAFQLGAAMTKVVDKLCAACPEAIVDFDITEGHRTVGLQFLSSGKYFLINNGPYNHDYNMPVPSDGNVNLFFFPGPARAWICRAPLNFDKWIPSVLFLTHYLPDDNHKEGWGNKAEVTGQNPLIALASLVLGQNGVWGDLLSLSEETIATFARITDFYKQVRQDITQAYPVRTGEVGGSPEVHEKVHTETGRGAVCLFASGQGTYTYTTQNKVNANSWATNGVVLKSLASGQAHIRATFGPGEYAKIVFFGVEP